MLTFFKTRIWTIRLADYPFVIRALLSILRIGILSGRFFLKNQCMLRASALTYYTLLALIPVAALAFAKAAAETGVSKVHSIFVSGYVMSFNEEDCQTVMGFTNVGAGYALYDEGAFRNEGAGGEHNPADLRYAPETLALVNASLKYNGQETVDEAVIGQIYGSPKNNSMVVLYNEHTLHALQPYDMNALASSLEFFDIAFDLQSDMSYMNQTWIYKEMFQGFMLVAAFVFSPAVGALLLRTAPFKSLVHKLPEKSPKLKGVGNHMVFWLTFAVGAVCACLLYIPTAHWAQQKGHAPPGPPPASPRPSAASVRFW